MKKSKLLKSLGFASLAVFMGATALFAFAPLNNTPIVAGGLNASANTENQTFDLGLRPDTDPVVYVTESGLEIKKSNGKYTSTVNTTSNNGTTHTQDLRNFYYFTMGKYSGRIYTGVGGTKTAYYDVSNEPVNWIILGRGSGFEFSDNTPAGDSIKTDNSKQEFAITPGGYLPMDMQAIPEDPADEIPENCFLVLSERILNVMYFNSTGAVNYDLLTSNTNAHLLRGQDYYYGGRYRYKATSSGIGTLTWNTSNNAGGDLYNFVNGLFSKNNTTGEILAGCNQLGFSQAQADMIIPQQLYTYYYTGSAHLQETPTTDGGTYYSMFPLGYRAIHSTYQNFCVDDYLTTPAERTAMFIGSSYSYIWYLRSGDNTSYRAYSIHPNGSYGAYYVHNSLGVRPAFVLRIME